MVISEKTYTWQEFETFAAKHPDSILELINGRIVEKVTNEKHGKIALNIGGELRAWAKHHQVKGHYGVDNSYRIPDDERNERRPDVSFRYSDEDVDEQISESVPEFCVEVKSPSNTYDELREKAQFYIANGAKLVWLVYPTKAVVEVYFADKTSELFLMGDKLLGGDVLPEFDMLVADIFDL